MFYSYYQSPIGVIKICATDLAVTKIEFVETSRESVLNDVVEKTAFQLKEYFTGKRTMFTIPVLQEGTLFQQSVWSELQKIPYGEVITYGGLAKKLGNKKAVRAVGAANGQNKIPIIIPCHRVTGRDGKLVGYAYGIERKRFLLNLEKKHSSVTAQLSLYV